MKNNPLLQKTRSSLTAFSLSSLLFLNASAQITAVNDGSTGSPAATTSEDAKINAGPSVSANDSGAFEIFTSNVTSANGAPVTIDTNPGTAGQFTYDPTKNPAAQALPAGGSLEDTFEYTIIETSNLTPDITGQLNPSLGVNELNWAVLPNTKIPDAGAPSSFSSVYDYSTTTAASTRAAFTDSGWNSTDVSLEFWIKQNTLENVTLFETGGSGVGSGIFLTDTGLVKWALKNNSNTATDLIRLDSTAAMTAGTWHHIVITHDVTSGTSTIYLDGNAAGTVTVALATNWSGTNGAGLGGINGDAGGDDNNNVGANAGTSQLNTWRNPFNGELGLFRFYSGKVMTPAEVQANRNNDLGSALATDTATVTVAVTGANDAPSGTVDAFPDGPFNNQTFTSARDLTANDGLPGSALKNLMVADLSGVTITQSPSVGTPPGSGFAGRAADQNRRRFTHTDSNDNTVDHTWEVNFGREVFLDTTILHNRVDCCGERLRDITVTVRNAAGVIIFTSPLLNPDNVLGFAGASGGELVVDFGGIMGQTVTVTRTPDLNDLSIPDGSVLSLGEVEIIGNAPTAGAALLANYDARYGTTNDLWSNLGSSGNAALDWELGSGVTLNPAVSSSRSQISAALEWDGTVNATGIFPGLQSINNVLGGAVDQQGATIEAWLKLDPADLSQISTIFETGGGTGFGLIVDNGVLKAACELDGAAGNNSTVSYDLVGDPLGVLDGFTTTNEFFQVAAVILPEGGLSLYVNGTQVSQTTAGNGADWDGGDASGLGHFQGTNHGGFVNGAETAEGGIYNTYFNGSMAMFRIYRAGLDAVEVFEAFRAVNEGTDIDGDSLTVDGVIDGSGALVTVGNQATLASGALVTFNNATGEFLYDPNGQFDSFSLGETATDRFTYQIDDGNGAKGYAEVIVSVKGQLFANDDSIAIVDGQTLNFDINTLLSNDSPLARATGAYLDLSPATLNNGTWTDAGTAGIDLNLNGNIQRTPEFQTDFGALGSALGTGGGTAATLDPISTADATFELWFRPEPGQSGKFTIYETGGNGNGFSIVYDAATASVTATVDGGDDATQNIQATTTGIRTDEFNQIIVAYDRDGGNEVGLASGIFEDLLSIYLNNDPGLPFDPTIDGSGVNLAGTANDWAGTDGSAISRVNGTSAFNENFPGLVGEVAALRVYQRILSASEMAQNYEATARGILTIAATTTQGVTLTQEANGTYSYDSSGLPALAIGELAIDTFTYTIDNGNGGTATGVATIGRFGSGNGNNQQPTASLNSIVNYVEGETNVRIVPELTVNDPDAQSGNNLSPTFVSSGAIATTLANPDEIGARVVVNFTLAASDIANGSKRVIYELGGTSNGQGVYLIDGIPYFIAKMNGINTTEAADLNLDADWDTDNLILVPLNGAPLSSGSPQALSLNFSGDALSWELNGGGVSTQALANRDTRTDWTGDDSLGFGQNSNGNGALTDSAGPFASADFLPLDGTIESAGFANYPAEEITATLTMPVANGAFTTPAGSTYTSDGTTGVWTATGPLSLVQQLLLNVEFLPTGISPATAFAQMSDGGENGTVPVSGTVVFTTAGDTDCLDPLLEFAFGTNPIVNDDGPLSIDGSVHGSPIILPDFSGANVAFSGAFVRRDDFGTSGSVIYTPQFSADLVTWTDGQPDVSFVAESSVNPDYEIVRAPFPPLLPSGQIPRFFRVQVTPVP